MLQRVVRIGRIPGDITTVNFAIVVIKIWHRLAAAADNSSLGMGSIPVTYARTGVIAEEAGRKTICLIKCPAVSPYKEYAVSGLTRRKTVAVALHIIDNLVVGGRKAPDIARPGHSINLVHCPVESLLQPKGPGQSIG